MGCSSAKLVRGQEGQLAKLPIVNYWPLGKLYMGENLSQCPFMSHGCFFLTVTNFDAIFLYTVK